VSVLSDEKDKYESYTGRKFFLGVNAAEKSPEILCCKNYFTNMPEDPIFGTPD